MKSANHNAKQIQTAGPERGRTFGSESIGFVCAFDRLIVH